MKQIRNVSKRNSAENQKNRCRKKSNLALVFSRKVFRLTGAHTHTHTAHTHTHKHKHAHKNTHTHKHTHTHLHTHTHSSKANTQKAQCTHIRTFFSARTCDSDCRDSANHKKKKAKKHGAWQAANQGLGPDDVALTLPISEESGAASCDPRPPCPFCCWCP